MRHLFDLRVVIILILISKYWIPSARQNVKFKRDPKHNKLQSDTALIEGRKIEKQSCKMFI